MRFWGIYFFVALLMITAMGCHKTVVPLQSTPFNVHASQSLKVPEKKSTILHVSRFEFSKNSNGPFEKNATFSPGQSLYGFLALQGLTTNAEGIANANADITLKDPQGRVMFQHDNFLGYRGKLDKTKPVYFKFDLQIPSFAIPGNYVISLLFHDNMAHTFSSFTSGFNVKGKMPPHFSTLTIFNGYFSTQFNGKKAINPPLFKPNQKVWLFYNLGGLLEKDGDMVWLVGSTKLIGPQNKVMFERPVAWEFHQKLDYVPSYLSFAAALDLSKKFPKGHYTYIITVFDKEKKLQANKSFSFWLQ
jgi:hypothetical protein